MSNPFQNWTPARVAEHNAKARPLRIETAASMLAEMRDDTTKKKTAKLNSANGAVEKHGSVLEQKFAKLWREARGPELVREFKFHHSRKWRADFAHLPSKTLIEIEGGVWNGRHTRGDGFIKDAEKHLAGWLAGWSVVRLTSDKLTADNINGIAMRVLLNTKTL